MNSLLPFLLLRPQGNCPAGRLSACVVREARCRREGQGRRRVRRRNRYGSEEDVRATITTTTTTVDLFTFSSDQDERRCFLTGRRRCFSSFANISRFCSCFLLLLLSYAALCHIASRWLEDDVRMLLPCLLLHMALSSSSSGLNFLSSFTFR